MLPGYDTSNYGLFNGFRVYNANVRNHSEGWKIHVAAAENRATIEHRLLLFELRQRDIPHKFVESRENYAGMDGNQKGKFITIYTNDLDEVRELVQLVNETMSPLKVADQAPTDYHIRSATIRYGAFEGSRVYRPEALRGQIDPNSPDAYMPDVRDQYKPDHIANPFDDQVPGNMEGYYDHLVVEHTTKGMPLKQARRRGEDFNAETMRFEKVPAATEKNSNNDE